MEIATYEPWYRDDLLYCYLAAKEALSGAPRLRDDLLNISGNYLVKGGGFWVALDEAGRVRGMCGVLPSGADDAWLKRLYVHPAWKRRGAGSALLARAEEFARAHGFCALHTRFDDGYREAAGFYSARGFVETERSEGFRHLVKRLSNGPIAQAEPEIHIRPADGGDFALLHAWDEHISADELRRLLPLGRVLIAERAAHPCGWLRWGMFWDEIPFLNMLCVQSEWQNQGLGTRLVRYWEDLLRQAGHRAVLASTMSNETAQHFYRKLGYVDAGGLLLPGEPLELLLYKAL